MSRCVSKAARKPPAKTAVVYARFSCSRQREASIDDQLRECEAWCDKNGYAVLARYCDYAMSGRTDERPEFQRMISNAGEAEVVVVYMMDRFSRDVYDAPVYKKRLKDKGVRVVSATESMPDGPEAILLENIYEAMAAMESANISKRVRRGLEGNALKCMHNGVRVFGYRFSEDGRYVVDEGQAQIVRECFARRISGESIGSIAAALRDRGLRPMGKRLASYGFVDCLLKNEKYTGVYSWGDVRIEGGMPAIVTRGEFEMARSAPVKKNRGTERWHDFALAGKGVCMRCGRNLVGVTGHNHKGKRYHYYRCSKRCGVKPIRADLLEEELASRLAEALRGPETMDAIRNHLESSDAAKEAADRLSAAQRAISDARRGIENILRAVEDGMPYSEVRGRLEELRAQEARAVEEAGSCAVVTAEDAAAFFASAAGLSGREIVDMLVWQAQLGDDVVVAVLNWDVNGEPARIELPRGFADSDSGRPSSVICEHPNGTSVALVGGLVVLSFSRVSLVYT